MLPDQVSNPGSLTYESGALPIALRGPAEEHEILNAYKYETIEKFSILQAQISLECNFFT